MSILLAGRQPESMGHKDIFNNDVPDKLQRAMLDMVFDACANASDHCYGTFSSDRVAKDVSGVYRRGLIEDQWLGMKSLFSHLLIEPVPYRHNTGTYYEITSGTVKLTQSCIYHPDEAPRDAEFRKTLATNGQRYLSFEDEAQPDIDPATFLYAVLTYGIASQDNRSRPWFVRVQFLNEVCTAYVDSGIDLVSKFPDIVSKYVPNADFSANVKERRWRKRKSA